MVILLLQNSNTNPQLLEDTCRRQKSLFAAVWCSEVLATLIMFLSGLQSAKDVSKLDKRACLLAQGPINNISLCTSVSFEAEKETNMSSWQGHFIINNPLKMYGILIHTMGITCSCEIVAYELRTHT